MSEVKYVNWILVTFKRFDLLSISWSAIDGTFSAVQWCMLDLMAECIHCGLSHLDLSCGDIRKI